MLNTLFTVSGEKLFLSGTTYIIATAGIRNDEPFAEVIPHNDFVVETICQHIRKCMPLPFSLHDIQMDLHSTGQLDIGEDVLT